MRDVIVPLDMVYVHRLRNGGSLVQIQQIAMKIRVVINNPAHVAFEVTVIDRIKTELTCRTGANRPQQFVVQKDSGFRSALPMYRAPQTMRDTLFRRRAASWRTCLIDHCSLFHKSNSTVPHALLRLFCGNRSILESP